MKQLFVLILTVLVFAVSPLFAETPIVTSTSSASEPLLIPYRNESIKIDGTGSDSVWSTVPVLDHFKAYWNTEEIPKTELRLFYNDKELCFLYCVEDADIVKAKLISEEMDIADEDRIELGFCPKSELRPYYFFEIDPDGRVLDYEARLYRHFDDTWDSNSLEVFGRITETGYEVEGKFALEELRNLHLLEEDGSMITGFFRGEYFHTEDKENNHRWISWVYSETAQPDFHLRSAFGLVQLEAK